MRYTSKKPQVQTDFDECYNGCMGIGNDFCQKYDKSNEGYCCVSQFQTGKSDGKCTQYLSSSEFGFCSYQVDHQFAKKMACPFLESVCSPRNSKNKEKVSVSADGKVSTIKSHLPMRKNQLCYYDISASAAQSRQDDFMILKIVQLKDVSLEVMISGSKTDDFMDLCTNL